ncbi:PAXNEB-domain-containing protein [Ascobolus immersus RN42]|uniref:Elongator complex protein 4 n=1 Tax=Ascobolus immersus RN42 TaxID=1160509 RepID=A0A3N4IC00_ASCIM|nr:PAXNEB-domain-containing protein [Ascobolus immersus RN42]
MSKAQADADALFAKLGIKPPGSSRSPAPGPSSVASPLSSTSSPLNRTPSLSSNAPSRSGGISKVEADSAALFAKLGIGKPKSSSSASSVSSSKKDEESASCCGSDKPHDHKAHTEQKGPKAFGKPTIQTDPTQILLKDSTLPLGVRKSLKNDQPVTSTGCHSLDGLLAGFGGLPLGSITVLEETGTTDFCTALHRYFAAEGVMQEQHVTVIGAGDRWAFGLPAAVGNAIAVKETPKRAPKPDDKMKIAWRYENLGAFGDGLRTTGTTLGGNNDDVFCHAYDLTKRMDPPRKAPPVLHLPGPDRMRGEKDPWGPLISRLQSHVKNSPPNSIHRILFPQILNPVVYPAFSAIPTHFINFMLALKDLIIDNPNRINIYISLPLALFPRETSITKYTEALSDVVIQLSPVPKDEDKKEVDETPQGVFSFWKLFDGELPTENLGFVQSKRRFKVVAWTLPPIDAFEEGASGGLGPKEGAVDKKSLEF